MVVPLVPRKEMYSRDTVEELRYWSNTEAKEELKRFTSRKENTLLQMVYSRGVILNVWLKHV